MKSFLLSGLLDFVQWQRRNYNHEYDEWYCNKHSNEIVDESTMIEEYLKQ